MNEKWRTFHLLLNMLLIVVLSLWLMFSIRSLLSIRSPKWKASVVHAGRDFVDVRPNNSPGETRHWHGENFVKDLSCASTDSGRNPAGDLSCRPKENSVGGFFCPERKSGRNKFCQGVVV